MQLRTPKRYMRGNRRSPISLRWLPLWIITPLVALGGYYLYNQREQIIPPVREVVDNFISNAENGLATVTAPTATPTENPTSRLQLAGSDWQEGRIESAVDNYMVIMDAVPNDDGVYYRITYGLIMEGRVEQAVEMAERTVTANPYSSAAWAIRAAALNRAGRYGEAIASALRALDINDANATALAHLSEAYFNVDEFDLAMSTAERAVETDPENIDALRVRGLMARAIDGDPLTASQYFDEAYAIAPNLPLMAINRARNLYYVDNNVTEAIAVLNGVLELNPENALLLNELGLYYFQGEGNLPQAAEILRRCLDSNPDSIDCNAYLGRVQYGLDDITGSIRSLMRAVDLGTTNAQYIFWLGRALRADGNCESAIEFLRRARDLAIEDNNTDVQAASDELLRECQVRPGFAATPTPESTLEATPPAGGSA
jgi:tetratricopeptide (TPR) repeat protein